MVIEDDWLYEVSMNTTGIYTHGQGGRCWKETGGM